MHNSHPWLVATVLDSVDLTSIPEFCAVTLTAQNSFFDSDEFPILAGKSLHALPLIPFYRKAANETLLNVREKQFSLV